MRMQTTTSAPCAYGLASQAGFLFERQRTAMRQNAFARARSATTKRKARESDDSDDSSSGDELQRPSKRVLMHGLKRMRVSSPPSASSTTPSMTTGSAGTFGGPAFASTVSPNAFASAATSDVAMGDEDEPDAERAIVPVGKPRGYSAQHKFSTTWPTPLHGHSAAYPNASNLQMPPSDASCTALVLFGGTSSIPRTLSPRIELVESDDENTHSCSDDDDSKLFVRFEEIHDDDNDNDNQAMEID